MLGRFTKHKDYLQFVLTGLRELAATHPEQIREFKNEISKMLILDLDPLEAIIKPLYPPIGKLAQHQMEIFRSFVLMKHTKVCLDNWVDKLSNTPVLRLIAGFSSDAMPGTSSYYDFINRIIDLDDRPVIRAVKRKPKKKLKKNEKLPPKNPNITNKLADAFIKDENLFMKRLSRRPERFLQKIFANVAVDSSINMGLIPTDADISGDGTCIETGASPFGKKVCDCAEKGIYNCDCPRKFSDPSAKWGWAGRAEKSSALLAQASRDSHNERYFYGYTGYFISTYNKDLKIDLPLYLRFVEASRHDSVSAIVSLAEFRKLYPNLQPKTFMSDSASDNYATYKLLHLWNIDAVIALNPKNTGNFKYPAPLSIDSHGCPLCPGGRKMVFWGFCNDRCRLKWRCPRIVKGKEPCASCSSCSDSKYGRVIYTKPEWDLRLFTRIPRGSDAWKAKMKQRTAAERVNNRILNNYGIETDATRGKKRISFFTTIAAVNVHLDAQLKFLRQNKLLCLDSLLASPADSFAIA